MAKSRIAKVTRIQPHPVKCDRCGKIYDIGHPHESFCRGVVPPNSKCELCGNDEQKSLLECRCGDIVCDDCHEYRHKCGSLWPEKRNEK